MLEPGDGFPSEPAPGGFLMLNGRYTAVSEVKRKNLTAIYLTDIPQRT
jgi:hypothetical protein